MTPERTIIKIHGAQEIDLTLPLPSPPSLSAHSSSLHPSLCPSPLLPLLWLPNCLHLKFLQIIHLWSHLVPYEAPTASYRAVSPVVCLCLRFPTVPLTNDNISGKKGLRVEKWIDTPSPPPSSLSPHTPPQQSSLLSSFFEKVLSALPAPLLPSTSTIQCLLETH